MSKRQTQEQKRAKRAWSNVHDEVRGKGFADGYKALVSSAPADIQINGLGQTVAFWHSKGWEKGKPKNNEHTALYQHVSRWVMQEMGVQDDLMHWITQTDSRRYRQATVEALAFLGWLKRFAQAEL
jgi:CRISPR-associated protein Cmr5